MQHMKLAQLLNHLESWASKYKLKRTDFTVSGAAALTMNGLLDTDHDTLVVYAKRKVFLKFAKAVEIDTKVFSVNSAISVHQNDDSHDTILRDGYKVLSLNQIVNELKGQPEFTDLVNKAKDLIEKEATSKISDAVKAPTGINPRKQLERRLRKQGRYTNRKDHWPYQR